ncbi:MAG TPA: alkaline phosphatase family protein [Candidatus Limnocylindrales bacterium]|nr:alkaline phosphatase family protein [Candidatus Limnocylindrales bacterium]
MKKKKKAIIFHIDGLGFDDAQEAIKDGHMPFLRNLLDEEEYEMLRYRSGIPSTTPYVQAGILYGDNQEIPAFRWYDRKKNQIIQLAGDKSFYNVDHRYFNKQRPLLENGAAIASLYAGGSKAVFAVSYIEKGGLKYRNSFSRDIILHLLFNPINNVRWHWHSFRKTAKIGLEVIKNIFRRKYMDWEHFPIYFLEQLLLYFPTSLAVKKALSANFPITYAGFYSYDAAAHLFGTHSTHGNGILKDIDGVLKNIQNHMKDKDECEMIIMSDHGETDFSFIGNVTGKTLAEHISKILPTYEITEHPGKHIIPIGKNDGSIILAYSGGLAHFYDASKNTRMNYKYFKKTFPDLIENILALDEVRGAIVRSNENHLFLTSYGKFYLNRPLDKKAREVLARYDTPEIVAKQLIDLSSFESAGDVIFIGQHKENHQISFEAPACGHGSIGGSQAHPFIMLKKSHKLDTGNMTDARHLYPFLSSLRD